MARKHEFKNKQKFQKSLKRKNLHARKLPLLQYMVMLTFGLILWWLPGTRFHLVVYFKVKKVMVDDVAHL